MFKNKLKTLLLLLVLTIFVFSPLAFAEDESVIIEEDVQKSNIQTNIADNDVYFIGDTVTVDYVVDGNVYILANTVNIDSQIVGNAFICANNVNISEQGYVLNSLYTAASNVDIKGVVCDVYTTSETTTISGYIYRDITVASKNLNIFGTIGRNASVSAASISFNQGESEANSEELTTTTQGKIIGDLNYRSSSEIEIPESTVDGEIKFEKETFSIKNYIVSFISFLLLTIVVWLLLKWLSPKFISKAETLLTKKTLPVIGFGILGFIAIPIISIVLLFTGFTSSIGLLIFATYCILLCVSTSVFIITLNNIVCNKLKIDKTMPIFGMLLVTAIIAKLLNLIPFVGTIISLIYIVLGLGIITKNLISKKDIESK